MACNGLAVPCTGSTTSTGAGTPSHLRKLCLLGTGFVWATATSPGPVARTRPHSPRIPLTLPPHKPHRPRPWCERGDSVGKWRVRCPRNFRRGNRFDADFEDTSRTGAAAPEDTTYVGDRDLAEPQGGGSPPWPPVLLCHGPVWQHFCSDLGGMPWRVQPPTNHRGADGCVSFSVEADALSVLHPRKKAKSFERMHQRKVHKHNRARPWGQVCYSENPLWKVGVGEKTHASVGEMEVPRRNGRDKVSE